ncbi:MAG TPA: hypothetical protein VH088_00655, partial [Terriglobales bacterium]|nr:hypothetical protein [Terriglobales bacterium]
MATGYSQDQLDLMDDVLEAAAPQVPGPEDRKRAYTVSAMKVSGTDLGVLLNLGFRKGESLLVMLNCVVSRELIISLTLGSLVHGWHLRGAGVACADHLQDPSPDHLSTA